MITLVGPELTDHGCAISCMVVLPDRVDRLWFRVDPQWRWFMAPSMDPFVTAMLPIAMKLGETLDVDAPMSMRLYAGLGGPVQDALVKVRPGLQRITIHAHGLCADPVREEMGQRAAGFSGGVDSWWVVGQHLAGSSPLDFLTFHDVGSHGAGTKGQVICERRLARARQWAQVIGLPLVVVRSNLRDWIYWAQMKFEEAPALWNLSAAQVLQAGVSEFLYAASFHETEPVREYTNSSIADPVLIPSLGTESLTSRLVGAHLTRVERTAAVAEIPASHNRLDVCFVSPERVINCGKCPKCMRTAITLDILGKLDLYNDAFDLGAFARAAPQYVRLLLRNPGVFEREVLRCAEENGIDLVNRYLPLGR